MEEAVRFGVRTVDGTANAGDDEEAGDYEAIDIEKEIEEGEMETAVRVKIIDDEGIEPDEDFYIELYDLETKERLPGQDTRTTVTILDDDKPGIFGFEMRATKVTPKDEKIRLKVLRLDGCDDDVQLNYRTIAPDFLSNPAIATKDYMPVEGTLYYETGETMKIVEVPILPKEEEIEEGQEVAFSVQLSDIRYKDDQKHQAENIEKPKLGKKSECFVEIVGDTQLVQKAKGIEEIIKNMQKDEQITWAKQFKRACMLSPQLDENNKMIEVSGFEAFLHF
mmetsp:Transcript_20070/g.19676  ORF Transcript_20070/g.19676 Transcript_20070/m.19676 type:complete len:279 (-) Transcript_20070:405-1241(-)